MINKLLLLISVITFFSKEGYNQIQAVNEKLTLQDTTNKVYNEKLSYLLTFPNVNKIAYYTDKHTLNQIQKLTLEKDDKALYPLLFNYVCQFGIENFFKNNYLLWQLAKLEEIRGDSLSAIHLYKLVLKHYHPETNLPQVYEQLDSLKVERKEDYVPLKYYYELVEYRKEVDTLRPPQGVYLNMGEGINSSDGDYGPALNTTDDLLIFTSKRNKMERGLRKIENEDLMISRKENGVWMEAQNFKEMNTPYNEGSACISQDGKSIFFSRCNSPEGMGSCDLYETHQQEDGTWVKAKNVGQHINSLPGIHTPLSPPVAIPCILHLTGSVVLDSLTFIIRIRMKKESGQRQKMQVL